MNALTDRFIPVRWNDGRVTEVGIEEALLSAHKITELADSSPLAVITQLRLLLALVMRVYPVEVDSDWLEMYAKEKLPTDPLTDYFDEWRGRFELFGDQPFYQVASLTTDKASPLSKLIPELASGNNATLFDHSDDRSGESYTPAEALRMLLVAQSFGLGGLLRASGSVFGGAFSHQNATDAPIARGLTGWLAGDTLFQTLMLNYVPETRGKDDSPCWETNVDAKYFAHATTLGPLDRFTALSRMVRLDHYTDPATGRDAVSRMYLTQGRAFDKAEQDPMQCYRATENAGYRPLLLNEDKATWRDLTALLQMNKTAGVRARALAFVGQLWANDELPRDNVRLHIAGMSADKAKVNLWRHDRVNLPTAFLADEQLVGDLSALLYEAESAESTILWYAGGPKREPKGGGRIWDLATYFVSPTYNPHQVSQIKKPDAKDVIDVAKSIDPRRTFWARLEPCLTDLIQDMPLQERTEGARTAWRDAIEEAFQEAVRTAKELLGPSPRAWRAAADVSDFYTVKGSTYDGNRGLAAAGSR